MYIFCYLFPFEAWVAAMIRMCKTIFLHGQGEKTIPKRYPNDTPKRILRALGRRSPAHPPTWTKHWHTKSWCNVFPFHISWVEAMAWKKEKKNQTKQQVFNITMAMCISKCRYDSWSDPVSHITGSFVGLDAVPVICCAALLKQYKFYFYWKGPRAHTRTHEQRVSFLQCSPEKGPFSSSTFGCKDFTCGEWGAFCWVWLHPPMLCRFVYRLKKNLKNDRGRDCNLLPCKNASESPSGQWTLGHWDFKSQWRVWRVHSAGLAPMVFITWKFPRSNPQTLETCGDVS